MTNTNPQFPSLDAITRQSATWQTLHPSASNKQLLEHIKETIEATTKQKVHQLLLMRQRFDNLVPTAKTLAYYGQATKVMSTSIDRALRLALPHLWLAAYYRWEDTQAEPQQAGTYDNLPDAAGKPVSAPFPEKFIAFCNITPTEIATTQLGVPHCMYPSRFLPTPNAPVRFCVLRDPVERFLSGFFDLIARPNTPQFNQLSQPEELLDILDDPAHDKQYDNFHLFPQTFFLGRETDYYTDIFTMQQQTELCALLSDLCGQNIALEEKNTRKSDAGFTPSPALLQRIQNFYADDYTHWGKHLP